MLCTRRQHSITVQGATSCSCVEPVLRTVLNRKTARKSFACLRCYTTSSVDAVDFLVVALHGIEFDPRHASESVRAFAGLLGCGALDSIKSCLYIPIVHSWSLQLEQWDLLLSELMVTAQPLLCLWGGGDGIIQGQASDIGKHLDVEPCSVAGCVEECGNGASGNGNIRGSGRSACVVLRAAPDGDVAKCVAITYCCEGRWCWCIR